MICGIYKITNKINNKVYIGQSVDIERRWKEHRHRPFNNNSDQYDSPLYRAIRKYGLDNFVFTVIEECSQFQLDEKEIFWINYYNSYVDGYNLTLGGGSGSSETGIKLTKQEVEKIREYLINTIKTQQEIANEFNISQKLVCLIDKGEVWLDPNLSYPLRNKQKVLEKRRIKHICIDCGIEISNKATRCDTCAKKLRRTTERPSREQLKQKIRSKSFVELGKIYGVTDNAIRKWCDAYKLPRTKKEITKYSDKDWDQI